MKEKEFRIGNYYLPTGLDKELKKVKWEDLRAWSMGAIYGRELNITKKRILNLGFSDHGKGVYTIDIDPFGFKKLILFNIQEKEAIWGTGIANSLSGSEAYGGFPTETTNT